MAAAAGDDDDCLIEFAAAYRPIVDEGTALWLKRVSRLNLHVPHNLRRLSEITPLFDHIVDSLPGEDYGNLFVLKHGAINLFANFLFIVPCLPDETQTEVIELFLPYVGRLTRHLSCMSNLENDLLKAEQTRRTIEVLDTLCPQDSPALTELLAATPDTMDLLTDVYHIQMAHPRGDPTTAERLLGHARGKLTQGRVKACRQSE